MRTVTLCTIQMYGLCFILLGLTCIAGHVLHLPFLTAMGSQTDMSPATGIGFITLGTSYFVLSKMINDRSRTPWGSRNW